MPYAYGIIQSSRGGRRKEVGKNRRGRAAGDCLHGLCKQHK
nr:MAG TPA: hypothetical protein [Caudoviricetes sp.]